MSDCRSCASCGCDTALATQAMAARSKPAPPCKKRRCLITCR
ncbi:hypothetical protein GLE_1401 [Lysobacter enzymogenes]|uniref:Uncharacterized protein n=1 Tax=Lysobacter enzymogenes TaxID=69 RepID=A0A0S2DDR4_LYSEN|nr:hypothetical protein GLE_1401 [Lysobacter enzymogenes]